MEHELKKRKLNKKLITFKLLKIQDQYTEVGSMYKSSMKLE